MVVVGRRTGGSDEWADQGRLARTAAFLRGGRGLVPRGVYRFSSFEEADAWMTRMMGGSLKVNDGAPAGGREAITGVAQGFMTAFPDMVVLMDDLDVRGTKAVYRWTLVGTNTGPGGTGRKVRISGFEEWRIGADGLIAESLGHFDAEGYRRQLEGGLTSS